jgi:hypothetical protein
LLSIKKGQDLTPAPCATKCHNRCGALSAAAL